MFSRISFLKCNIPPNIIPENTKSYCQTNPPNKFKNPCKQKTLV